MRKINIHTRVSCVSTHTDKAYTKQNK